MNIKIFGQNLKAILEAKNIKPIDFARVANISRGYLSLLLQGAKDNPSMKVLNKIAIALDISPDHLPRLFEPSFDLESFLSRKSKSILVPFLFRFSSLTPQTIEEIRSASFDVSHLPPSIQVKPFISFPKCEPFTLMEGQKLICFTMDIESGMFPTIQQFDILTVDLSNHSPREKNIFLCSVAPSLKIRYASEYKLQDTPFIKFWAEERRYPDDILSLEDLSSNPVLGRVITITRRFNI